MRNHTYLILDFTGLWSAKLIYKIIDFR